MPRIPYPDIARPETAPVAGRIQAERGKLLNLYRMLLHSPPVADGWRAYLTVIRSQCALPGRTRELVILRIAVINGADYEFAAHVPYALKEGLSEAQLDTLKAGREAAGLTDADRAAIAYAEAMTRTVQVPDAVFAAVRRHVGDRELVELTATIGAYNMVSRFLEALLVDHD